MGALSSFRVVLVQAGRQGSGYLITSRLVLTSAHILGDDRVMAVVPGGTGAQRCNVVWVRQDEECDAALLLAEHDLVGPDRPLTDVVWGTADDLSAVSGCEAVGFPSVARYGNSLPDTEQFVGTLKPGSLLMRGRYVLDSDHAAPPAWGEGSPWAGMSGAAVFAGAVLAGVVVGDPNGWAHGRVDAIPAATLVADASFARTLIRYTGKPPGIGSLRGQQGGRASEVAGGYVRRRVSGSEASDFGAHRTAEVEGYPTQVPYIPRVSDTELDRKMEAVGTTGGVLIAVGDSAAGKSRSMFEAMKRIFPSRNVFIPDPDAELGHVLQALLAEAQMPGVLWLDELHYYLRPDGLTVAMLEDLRQARVVVLGTLRSEYYELLSQPPGPNDWNQQAPGASRAASVILRRAGLVEMERQWTSVERESASTVPDPRVEEALRAGQVHGVAECLAAGPQVLERWKRASRAGGNPRGAALVAASIDLARTGLDAASPSASIERLHGHYLEAAGGAALRPEPLEEAWRWAGAVVLGVTSPLIPGSADRWRPFDYLVSSVARYQEPRTIPDYVWNEAVALADDKRRSLVTAMARAARRFDVAASLWTVRASDGDTDAMITVGAMLARAGKETEAEQWFLRASESGNPMGTHNMGALMQQRGDLSAARDWYSRAVAAGVAESRGPLGAVLESTGDEAGAVEQWKQGTELGDASSAFRYAQWLRGRWESEESVKALRAAADAELPIAMLFYAGVLLVQQKLETANEYLKRAYVRSVDEARLGDANEAQISGLVANALGDAERAAHWWAVAHADGHVADWQIIEADGGSPGLRALAVSHETLRRLGRDEILLLMSMLWAGDCLDCGYSLGEGVPALQVTDDYDRGSARIYHLGLCRFPRWNDSALREYTKSSALSWRSLAGAVPDDEGLLCPVMIVNPGLEQVNLLLDGETWRVVGYAEANNSSPFSLGAEPLWKSQIPAADSRMLLIRLVEGELYLQYGVEVWAAHLTPMLTDLIRNRGGFLLVLTSGLAPEAEGSAAMRAAFESFDAARVWVSLDEIAGDGAEPT
ncbi:bifunctional trypsin-like peptidase domain-containing/SEL1-like repeat protein [Kitasatospora sp. NPDC053057]|uniref:bifunctional trypsin-like peptidase domain-containing/SEL1-like repeat protein n=1 Tax=Kitasatospora sp. NPDC053057 TaxID=3364062 RepID=UPI0037C55620